MAKKLSTSPRGTLVFPWLQKADTKFDSDGTFKTGLRLKADDEKAVALMKRIDDLMEQAVKEAKENAKTPKDAKKVKMCEDRPYKLETDDDDEPTGYVIFNFKMSAQVKGKNGDIIHLKPALFDASGSPLDKESRVGAGSLARVSFEAVTFYQVKIGAGVSLRLYGVQIIKLVEWGGGDAEFHGFEDESDEEATDTGAEDADDSEDEDEDDDEDDDEEGDEEEEAPKAKAKKGKTSKDDDF